MARNMIRLLVSLASTLQVASGARISVRTEGGSTNSSRIGPEDELLIAGTKYACMQKWQSSGSFGGAAKYVDQFCLANIDKAMAIAQAHLIFAPDIASCQARDAHKMKLCALKGEKPEGRISYQTKAYVPKSCLRASSSAIETYAVVEAAVDDKDCEAMLKLPVKDQAHFGAAITTTTTTTTEEEEESDSLDGSMDGVATVDCECDDGFEGQIVQNQCICTAAPCDVAGAINSGPECACMPGLRGDIAWSGSTASGECIIDAKDLFTDGPMKVWEYKGKAIKCCVPTVVAPTELQDMNAEQLPNIGYLGRSDKHGCGYMFGDHYHNGMKPYKARTESTCPVSVAKIMEVTGEGWEEIKYILDL